MKNIDTKRRKERSNQRRDKRIKEEHGRMGK